MKKSSLLLVLAAFFWGTSGLLTQTALIYNTTMMLVAIRFSIAAVLALLFFKTRWNKLHLKNGFILSILLIGIYVTSTLGLKYTSASNAGFIIGSNVILVPLINRLFLKEKIQKKNIIKSIVCLIGLALVTLKGAQPINIGDLLCFFDAIIYSLYIIYGSRLSKEIDTKSLITIQYTFVAVLTSTYVLFFESPKLNTSADNLLSLFALGFFCTFLAFYFQLKAQKEVSSEKASQLLALMPIFTILLDVLFVGLVPSAYAFIGGMMIILATSDIKVPVNKITKSKRRYRVKQVQ